MIIGARTAAWSGAPLPYDAEVEYLESTGKQWIDTAVQSSDKVQFSVWVDTVGSDMKLFGNSYYLGQWADISWYNSVYRDTKITQVAQTWDTVTLEKSPKLLTVSRLGDLFTASSWWSANRVDVDGIDTYGTAVPLFSHINKYGTKYGDNVVNGWYSPSFHLRISFFKAWSNGDLIRDLITVRKGTVGYMYDRVSGQLFGNQGTGDFIISPDKTT